MAAAKVRPHSGRKDERAAGHIQPREPRRWCVPDEVGGCARDAVGQRAFGDIRPGGLEIYPGVSRAFTRMGNVHSGNCRY